MKPPPISPLVLAGIFVTLPSIFCLAWEMKSAPLMSQWATQVTPENALPDYPRPQMVRPQWRNLNGLWEFSSAREGDSLPTGKPLPERILVPFPVESPLSGVMRMAEWMWYRRTFTVPADGAGQRILIHFGAVDWQATVFVNGKEVGRHQGGYGSFSFDITDALRPGENEVIVKVFDPTDVGHQPVGKQTKKPRGYWYTSVSGIWQTVWLEPVPATHITRLDLIPDVNEGKLRLTVQTAGPATPTVEAVVSTPRALVGRATGPARKEISIPIPNARLWSPDDPFLYDLTVTLKDANSAAGAVTGDTVTSYFGMRSITIGKVNGVPRPLLNGRFIFLIGALDQGFWPDGVYTAPTDEALRFDLEQQKKIGYNVVRKHIKVEPARWYYWADKLGLLVMQDMPSSAPRGLNPDLTEREKPFRPNGSDMKVYEAEFWEMMDQLRNSPAVIAWLIFNEHWGAYEDKNEAIRLTRRVKDYDPSRLVITDTGAGGKSVAGDAYDWHTYPGLNALPSLVAENRISGQGEFGGIGLVIKDHSWLPANKDQDTAAAYTARYVGMIDVLKQLMLAPGLSYAIFTQATDVEMERNGLFTYDRAVFKGDMAAIRAAHEHLIAASHEVGRPFTATFHDDFAQDSGAWTVAGTMARAGNALVAAQPGIALAATHFNNLSCETSVTLPDGGSGGLIFRASGPASEPASSPATSDRLRGYYAGVSTAGELTLSYSEDGKWSPIQTAAAAVEAEKPLRLRVTAFGGTIRIYAGDMTVPKIEVNNSRVLAGAVGVRAVTAGVRFADFRAANPFVQLKPLILNGFVTHDSRQQDIVVIDTNVNRYDDSLWQIVPGLGDAQAISFACARQPGFYLRDRDGQVTYEKDDGTPDFKRSATWKPVPGLADSAAASYESLIRPGEYLRHRASKLFRTPCPGEGEKRDATFFEMK